MIYLLKLEETYCLAVVQRQTFGLWSKKSRIWDPIIIVYNWMKIDNAFKYVKHSPEIDCKKINHTLSEDINIPFL